MSKTWTTVRPRAIGFYWFEDEDGEVSPVDVWAHRSSRTLYVSFIFDHEPENTNIYKLRDVDGRWQGPIRPEETR